MQKKILIKETALLVVDIINFCCHQDCEIGEWNIHFKKIRKMVPSLNRFIEKYKKKAGNIVYVNCTTWKKGHIAGNLEELYMDPCCRYYSNDTTGFSERFFMVSPKKNDLIITKDTYDAFTNPKLDKFLKKKNIRYILIAGVFGDGCVHSTIQGGFSAGYNIIILKDLIETTDSTTRQKLQALLKDYTWPVMFGRTIDSEKLFGLLA